RKLSAKELGSLLSSNSLLRAEKKTLYFSISPFFRIRRQTSISSRQDPGTARNVREQAAQREKRGQRAKSAKSKRRRTASRRRGEGKKGFNDTVTDNCFYR